MMPNIQLTPDQQAVVARKAELDKYIVKLTTFISSSPEYQSLPDSEKHEAHLQLESYRAEALQHATTIAGYYKVGNKHHLCQNMCKREQHHELRCAEGACKLLQLPTR